MEQAFFWQLVAAGFMANALFAATACMVWFVSRWEAGKAPKPSVWVFAFGLWGPGVAAVSLYSIL